MDVEVWMPRWLKLKEFWIRFDVVYTSMLLAMPLVSIVYAG
jgi:hypothetical protein